MTDAIMTSEATRTDIDQTVEIEDSTDRTDIGLHMSKIIGKVISKVA